MLGVTRGAWIDCSTEIIAARVSTLSRSLHMFTSDTSGKHVVTTLSLTSDSRSATFVLTSESKGIEVIVTVLLHQTLTGKTDAAMTLVFRKIVIAIEDDNKEKEENFIIYFPTLK